MEIQKNNSFISSIDQLIIYYDLYIPENSNGKFIQIAHGMIEYKDRYQEACEYFCKQGYVVVINDHRGHGKSIDKEHPLGEMSGDDKSGFQKAIIDMHTLTEIIKNQYPSHDMILIGHSMGSLLSRGYFKQYGENLKALLLLGSPAYDPLTPLGFTLLKILKFLGFNQIGKHIAHTLMLGKFDRPFKQEDPIYSYGKLAWLNRSKEAVENYKQDQNCQFMFTLQSCLGLLQGLMYVQEPLGSKQLPHIPIAILSGTDDPCGHAGKGVKHIVNLFEQNGFNVTLKLYEKARHELLLEINKEEVLTDILEFLKNI